MVNTLGARDIDGAAYPVNTSSDIIEKAAPALTPAVGVAPQTGIKHDRWFRPWPARTDHWRPPGLARPPWLSTMIISQKGQGRHLRTSPSARRLRRQQRGAQLEEHGAMEYNASSWPPASALRASVVPGCLRWPHDGRILPGNRGEDALIACDDLSSAWALLARSAAAAPVRRAAKPYPRRVYLHSRHAGTRRLA